MTESPYQYLAAIDQVMQLLVSSIKEPGSINMADLSERLRLAAKICKERDDLGATRVLSKLALKVEYSEMAENR